MYFQNYRLWKSWLDGCLLTHWLPRASILFKIGKICHSQCKCYCLTFEKHFLNFLFHFWNLQNTLNILKEKMIVIANVFPKLQTVKILISQSLKSVVSKNALTVDIWKPPKYLRNLNQSTFIMFFHDSQGSGFGKCLP